MIFLLIRLSKIRSHRLSVRTVGFHPTKRGSIPLGTANLNKTNFMKKIAVIEKIHKDGLEKFLEKIFMGMIMNMN